jgi:hypothetical protein
MKIVREPLLGPPQSHILYYAPNNRLGVTSAHRLPRFARLLVSDSTSPRVKETMQATFVIKSRQRVLVLGACLMSPCLVPLVLWSIRMIIEASIERKTAVHIMVL